MNHFTTYIWNVGPSHSELETTKYIRNGKGNYNLTRYPAIVSSRIGPSRSRRDQWRNVRLCMGKACQDLQPCRLQLCTWMPMIQARPQRRLAAQEWESRVTGSIHRTTGGGRQTKERKKLVRRVLPFLQCLQSANTTSSIFLGAGLVLGTLKRRTRQRKKMIATQTMKRGYRTRWRYVAKTKASRAAWPCAMGTVRGEMGKAHSEIADPASTRSVSTPYCLSHLRMRDCTTL